MGGRVCNKGLLNRSTHAHCLTRPIQNMGPHFVLMLDVNTKLPPCATAACWCLCTVSTLTAYHARVSISIMCAVLCTFLALQIVSYKWLARRFSIPSNYAKQ